jgi:hypothetical protein
MNLNPFKSKSDKNRKITAAQLNNAKKAGLPLIGDVFPSDPNSACGVDVKTGFKNISKKTIKYINIDVLSYNAVGDIQKGSTRNYTLGRLQYTGPIEPGKIVRRLFTKVWYNCTITCVNLKKIEVIFMDKTKMKVTGQKLEILSPDNSTKCKYKPSK